MKKPFFKKWWFWVIVAVVLIGIIGGATGVSNDEPADNTITDTGDTTSKTNNGTKKEYQKIDLQTMIDELKSNAMKAEKTYQNAYIEITGKIANIDSDGSYITVEALNAPEFNFDTVMCYIKNSEQRNIIIEKSVGDEVTIKGKIISIGEVLGYSLNIDSIS